MAAAAVDQRHLNKKASIADITKWRMIGRRVLGHSLRPLMNQLKHSHHSSQGPAALHEVGQVGGQTALRGDEEGAIEYAQGNHSPDCRVFLTILDKAVTVGELAGDEERSGWPHPHPHGLLEGA